MDLTRKKKNQGFPSHWPGLFHYGDKYNKLQSTGIQSFCTFDKTSPIVKWTHVSLMLLIVVLCKFLCSDCAYQATKSSRFYG
jgi:hypothetical protein